MKRNLKTKKTNTPRRRTDLKVACVASVSARVRRESWDLGKFPFFFALAPTFAFTRLETLATQAYLNIEEMATAESGLKTPRTNKNYFNDHQ